MKIRINKNPNGTPLDLYFTDEVDLNPGLTVIVGRNGSGKTTFLHTMEEYCKNNEIPCYSYDNYTEGGDHAKEVYGFKGMYDDLFSVTFKSEGEQIYHNLGNRVYDIGAFVKKYRDNKELVILLDALDSGFDTDGLKQIKDICNLIISDNKNSDVYILVTANNYGLVKDCDCLDIRNNKYIRFDSYVEYEEFISNQYKLDRKREKEGETNHAS